MYTAQSVERHKNMGQKMVRTVRDAAARTYAPCRQTTQTPAHPVKTTFMVKESSGGRSRPLDLVRVTLILFSLALPAVALSLHIGVGLYM